MLYENVLYDVSKKLEPRPNAAATMPMVLAAAPVAATIDPVAAAVADVSDSVVFSLHRAQNIASR